MDNPVEVHTEEAAKPKRVERVSQLDRIRTMMRSPRMYDRMKVKRQESVPVLQKSTVQSVRPTTARVFKARQTDGGMSRVSTAVSLKTRNTGFHVMTLREAAIQSYQPRASYKRPVSRHTYN